MAWSDFYFRSGGSNLNSGSTNADAATLTYASGNWVQGTGVFTVASGDPSADGISVGDWVSVYANGSTVTPFVGKVTARDTTTITVDLTNKFGTAPTDGTGNRTLKMGGAWASLVMLASGSALNTGTVTQPTRINFLGTTLANTTTSRTWGMAGSRANPLWWRGSSASIGDLDSNPDALTKPSITWTTGSGVVSGAYQKFTAIRFVSASTTQTLNPMSGSAGSQWYGCEIENTSTGQAINFGGAPRLERCWIKTASTTNPALTIDGAGWNAIGNWIIGGSVNVTTGSQQNTSFFGNVLLNATNDAISISGNVSFSFINNTIYNCGRDAIRRTAGTASDRDTIVNNIFSVVGGYVYNTLGTAVGLELFMSHNLYHSITSGVTNGVNEFSDIGELTDSSSPFVAAGTDFTPLSTSNAYQTAAPQIYLTTSQSSRLSRGAIQPQGGGLLIHGGMTGGMQRT